MKFDGQEIDRVGTEITRVSTEIDRDPSPRFERTEILKLKTLSNNLYPCLLRVALPMPKLQ